MAEQLVFSGTVGTELCVNCHKETWHQSIDAIKENGFIDVCVECGHAVKTLFHNRYESVGEHEQERCKLKCPTCGDVWEIAKSTYDDFNKRNHWYCKRCIAKGIFVVEEIEGIVIETFTSRAVRRKKVEEKEKIVLGIRKDLLNLDIMKDLFKGGING
jgi:uncharacterized C2H2 Zn-finger protein